jgi:hypothetical protein
MSPLQHLKAAIESFRARPAGERLPGGFCRSERVEDAYDVFESRCVGGVICRGDGMPNSVERALEALEDWKVHIETHRSCKYYGADRNQDWTTRVFVVLEKGKMTRAERDEVSRRIKNL